jgi:site-specific recombinase XerD
MFNNSEKTKFRLIFNRRKKLNKQGKAALEIEISMNGSRKWISTKIALSPDQWDGKRNSVKGTHPNAPGLNLQLTNKLAELEKLKYDAISNNRPVSFALFTDPKQQKKQADFVEFFKAELRLSPHTMATINSHRATLNHLLKYSPVLPFEAVDVPFVEGFTRYLKADPNIKANDTVMKHYKVLKIYINKAINHKLIKHENNPFNIIKMKYSSSGIKYLEEQEVQKLEALRHTLPKQEQHLLPVLDMFLFSCYTGLRFSDVTSLQPHNIAESKGRYKLALNQQKTGGAIGYYLNEIFNGKALELYKQYSKNGTEKPFPSFTNQYTNRALKELAALAGIDKKLRFHMSRHTAGTLLLNKGVAMPVVQKILGHRKIATTELYSKILDATVDAALAAAFSSTGK